MEILKTLQISREDVVAYREATGCSVDYAKRHFVREKLRLLVDEIQDPAARLVLQVLVESY